MIKLSTEIQKIRNPSLTTRHKCHPNFIPSNLTLLCKNVRKVRNGLVKGCLIEILFWIYFELERVGKNTWTDWFVPGLQEYKVSRNKWPNSNHSKHHVAYLPCSSDSRRYQWREPPCWYWSTSRTVPPPSYCAPSFWTSFLCWRSAAFCQLKRRMDEKFTSQSTAGISDMITCGQRQTPPKFYWSATPSPRSWEDKTNVTLTNLWVQSLCWWDSWWPSLQRWAAWPGWPCRSCRWWQLAPCRPLSPAHKWTCPIPWWEWRNRCWLHWCRHFAAEKEKWPTFEWKTRYASKSFRW